MCVLHEMCVSVTETQSGFHAGPALWPSPAEGLASRPPAQASRRRRALSNPGSGYFQVYPHPGLVPGRCPPSVSSLALEVPLLGPAPSWPLLGPLPRLLHLVLPDRSQACAPSPQSLHPLGSRVSTRPTRSSWHRSVQWTLGGTPRPKPDLTLLLMGPVGALLCPGPSGGPGCGRCLANFLYVVFAENKHAEGKENQDVALEKADDIHDVMVGPRGLVGSLGQTFTLIQL